MCTMEAIVPWACTEEWKAVGELLYSQDIKKLRKAYWILRGWKSRCLKLPAGAECSIIILEALLIEDEMKDTPTLKSHSVLASCYAMALTRFLNLASSFEKEKTYFSMYRIARHLNLPEWIVNLRHQSSHGLELPSLVVLKAGLTLALEWLDKEYWKIGVSESPDSLIEKFSKRFSSLVVSYQDIMKQKMCRNGCQQEENSNLDTIMKVYVAPNDDDWLLDCGSNEEVVKEVPKTLNECLMVIVGKLQAMFIAAEKKSLDIGLLLQHFLWTSLFLPTEDALNLYSNDLNRNTLPREMILVWSTFLEEVINKSGLITTFIQKLIDFKSKQENSQRWASIWVKYLSNALRNAQKSKHALYKQKKSMSPLSRKSERLATKKEVKQSQWTIVFDMDFLPGKSELNPLIEDVIYNPRRSTLVYIAELLGLYEKPFSDEKAAMIVKAIEIQLQTIENSALIEEADSIVGEGEIEELCGKLVSQENVIINNGKRKASESENEYTDISCGWENLPLGVYPNYRQHSQAQGATQELEEDVVYFSD